MQGNLKLVFCIFVIVSLYIVHVLIARSGRNRFSKILSEITLAGMVSSVSYCLFIMFRSYTWAFLSVTAYSIALDWMVYFIFVYVLILTEAGPKLTVIRFPLKILFFLDSVDLLINIFLHHRFDLAPVTAETTIKHFYGVITLWNQVSRIISYGVALLTLCILIYKIVKANFFVRKKYIPVLGGFLFVLVINLYCVVFNTEMDYSILFYFLGALFLWYGTTEAFPKRLVKEANEILIQTDRRMVMYFDLTGRCLFANMRAERFFNMEQNTGYQAAESVCRPLYELMEKMIRTDEQWENQPHLYKLNLEEQIFYVRYYIWYLKDIKGRNAGYCVSMEDRTKARENQLIAKYRDFHDDLTGVLNRTGFMQEGKAYLEENEEKAFNLIIVNIRNFKLINNMFGSEVGDRILQNLANAIHLSLNGKMITLGKITEATEFDSSVDGGADRDKDIPIGRMGGDRFAFLLNREIQEKQTIEKITTHTLMPFEKYHYRLELVFGICPVDNLAESVHSFYNKATLAAQAVGAGIAHNYAYYDDELMKMVLHEKELVDLFDEALESGQFTIYIQPQYDSHGMIRGGEALVRWIHPESGLMEPMSFIDVYERAGCIHKLDLFVWEKAVACLQKWQNEGLEEYYLAVNISIVDFFYLDVYEEITRLTKRYGINKKRLKLEITETVMMNDAERVLGILEKLREAGYIIEVDDFGSGFSSLNRLKDIPAEGLKMDLGFLAETKNKQRRRAITDSIIYLGKRLNMKVIAEGVETKEQYEELAMVGCELFQGFLFSKPIPLSQFEELMKQG